VYQKCQQKCANLLPTHPLPQNRSPICLRTGSPPWWWWTRGQLSSGGTHVCSLGLRPQPSCLASQRSTVSLWRQKCAERPTLTLGGSLARCTRCCGLYHVLLMLRRRAPTRPCCCYQGTFSRLSSPGSSTWTLSWLQSMPSIDFVLICCCSSQRQCSLLAYTHEPWLVVFLVGNNGIYYRRGCYVSHWTPGVVIGLIG
jgi:hypothetical protein